jgi:hypothetical protein
MGSCGREMAACVRLPGIEGRMWDQIGTERERRGENAQKQQMFGVGSVNEQGSQAQTFELLVGNRTTPVNLQPCPPKPKHTTSPHRRIQGQLQCRSEGPPAATMPLTDEDAAMQAMATLETLDDDRKEALQSINAILGNSEPFVDVHELFKHYDILYFRRLLSERVEVLWSPRLTL